MTSRAQLGLILALWGAAPCALALASAPVADAQPALARPWLGVSMSKDGRAPGVLVAHVVHGSPADKTGLREGDRIVRVAGTPVVTALDVVQLVAAHGVGDSLEIAYVRGDHEASARAPLAPFPAPDDVMRMDLVGFPAPDWSHIGSASGVFPKSIADLHGRVVLLDFWATWCGPCRLVAPKLASLQNRRGAEGLTVLGLSSEDADQVLAYVRRQSPRYALGLDSDAETARRYGVVSLPSVVAVDRRGVVRDVFVGYDPSSEARLEATVTRLLGEQAAAQ